MRMKYLFGPINSRRLGRSLGIDIVPYKTCSLNCVYCECGATTNLTSETGEYVPTDDVLLEIDYFLSGEPELDVITFSGSGEPTLHSGIGDIIDYIKINFPLYRIAVLTNGTLLWKKDVRERLMLADLVIPSLDTVTEESFSKMLRPHPDITPDRVIDGLVSFGSIFDGTIILEVFIVPGMNDSESELKQIKSVCEKVKHDEIHINTLDRPAAEKGIRAADNTTLAMVIDIFKPLNVKIVGKPAELEFTSSATVEITETILSMIKRRPSTIDDLQRTLGLNLAELEVILDALMKKGLVCLEKQGRGVFYRLA